MSMKSILRIGGALLVTALLVPTVVNAKGSSSLGHSSGSHSSGHSSSHSYSHNSESK